MFEAWLYSSRLLVIQVVHVMSGMSRFMCERLPEINESCITGRTSCLSEYYNNTVNLANTFDKCLSECIVAYFMVFLF